MAKVDSGPQECVKVPIKYFEDSRGFFSEVYKLSDNQHLPFFIQENVSFSKKNVVRGMHFQTENPQGKLVRVLTGIVIDVVVDMRDRETFGTVLTFVLQPQDFAVYVPPGFAHGFWAIRESILHYKCTQEYHRQSDGGINSLDDDMNYIWNSSKKNLIVSDKDRALPYFRDFTKKFM